MWHGDRIIQTSPTLMPGRPLQSRTCRERRAIQEGLKQLIIWGYLNVFLLPTRTDSELYSPTAVPGKVPPTSYSFL